MSPIRFMARNHVAANVLMVVLLVGGLVGLRSITVEVFPELELDKVTVSMVYPGAGPEEVEEGICQPVEEAVHGLDGVRRVQSTSSEGLGVVIIDLLDGADVDLVLQDVKAAVDRIITFPQDAERPIVQKVMRRRSVMSLVVYGDMDLHILRERGERVRDDLLSLPEITQAELAGVPPYEISIEIDEATLRRYGLTLDQVAAVVRAASLDLPAGGVKSKGGEILLRTKERRYAAREYETIVVVSKPDGTLVRLGDIATVRETFEETDEHALFQGKPAAMIEVYRVGDQTPYEISRVVNEYIEREQRHLPAAVRLAVWNDRSEILDARLQLLLKNAYLGLILVIIILGLFLQVRLAFWVTLGIPISMLGALVIVPWLDVTINMLSLFAFIVVLGIVVDDAIVVGENVFTHRSRGASATEASMAGTTEVARPVIFSVLTTVAAFAPLLFVSGLMGEFMRVIPIIAISVLMVSLIESLLVLPAHLSRSKPPKPEGGGLFGRAHRRFAEGVRWFIRVPYGRTLAVALRYRYSCLAVALALALVVVGLFVGRHIKFIFMPELEGDVVRGKIVMPFGSNVELTEKHLARMQDAAQQAVAHFDQTMPAGQTVARNIFTLVGGHLGRGGPHGRGSSTGSHLGEIAVFLKQRDERNVDSETYAQKWRELVGEIPGVESLEFDAALMSPGPPIDIQLGHQDFRALEEAAARVKAALREYPGVLDVADSHEAGKRELKLKLQPQARALGINERDLASQVRSAFYGAEALRLQRGRNEVRVMVRYPVAERRSLADVDSMRVRTARSADGHVGEVPFGLAAAVSEGRGYSAINRADRKRVIHVTARVALNKANPVEIIEQLKRTLLPRLVADYPGLSYDLEGQERERQESFASLKQGYVVALCLIFALLAIPFRSYSQPLIIMSAIPFGIIGAVGGHLLLGYDISLLSLMGVVALSGVVVNDSLVLIDFINRNRRAGRPLMEAVLEGGRQRFRPILLTTLTTFFALLPMLAETSVQARFLVPMAISLAFGVLFATFITLILIPVFYMILEDLKRWGAWLLGRTPEDREDESEVPSGKPAA